MNLFKIKIWLTLFIITTTSTTIHASSNETLIHKSSKVLFSHRDINISKEDMTVNHSKVDRNNTATEWTSFVGKVQFSLFTLEEEEVYSFLKVSNDEENKKNIEIDLLDYIEEQYILSDPYKKIETMNGYPNNNSHLIKLTSKNMKHKLKNMDKYKFSFFGKKKTTIAILSTRESANGHYSTQSIYLFDTESNQSKSIKSENFSLSWVKENRFNLIKK